MNLVSTGGNASTSEPLIRHRVDRLLDPISPPNWPACAYSVACGNVGSRIRNRPKVCSPCARMRCSASIRVLRKGLSWLRCWIRRPVALRRCGDCAPQLRLDTRFRCISHSTNQPAQCPRCHGSADCQTQIAIRDPHVTLRVALDVVPIVAMRCNSGCSSPIGRPIAPRRSCSGCNASPQCCASAVIALLTKTSFCSASTITAGDAAATRPRRTRMPCRASSCSRSIRSRKALVVVPWRDT